MKEIATIKKGAREEIRVTREEYKGRDLVNIRTWYQQGANMAAGKQGIAFSPELLPALLDALGRAGDAK